MYYTQSGADYWYFFEIGDRLQIVKYIGESGYHKASPVSDSPGTFRQQNGTLFTVTSHSVSYGGNEYSRYVVSPTVWYSKEKVGDSKRRWYYILTENGNYEVILYREGAGINEAIPLIK